MQGLGEGTGGARWPRGRPGIQKLREEAGMGEMCSQSPSEEGRGQR